jgi:anti-sigma regulatory factor (Ser/Thr protein kinase)
VFVTRFREDIVGHDAEGDAYASLRVLETPRRLSGPLPGPPRTAAVRELAIDIGALASLRHFVSDWASAQELEREGVEELVLAVNELASNSIRHGGGRGTLRVWRDAQDLVCEVQDAGHIVDPLVGRMRPAPNASSGRGLWMVDHLCDTVQIRSSRAGTVVRVHKHRG